jgi:hypothetical protein
LDLVVPEEEQVTFTIGVKRAWKLVQDICVHRFRVWTHRPPDLRRLALSLQDSVQQVVVEAALPALIVAAQLAQACNQVLCA